MEGMMEQSNTTTQQHIQTNPTTHSATDR